MYARTTYIPHGAIAPATASVLPEPQMPEQNSKRLAATANRLYWQTSKPAGQLAEDLGISRSKFYALIEPLTLEQTCTACDGALAYSSRSDRQSGRGRCSDCGTVAVVSVKEAPVRAPARQKQRPPRPPRPPRPLKEASDERVLPPALPTDSRPLWITAAVGVTIGLLLATWLRRR